MGKDMARIRERFGVVGSKGISNARLMTSYLGRQGARKGMGSKRAHWTSAIGRWKAERL